MPLPVHHAALIALANRTPFMWRYRVVLGQPIPSDPHSVNLPSLLLLSLRSVICKVPASDMPA